MDAHPDGFIFLVFAFAVFFAWHSNWAGRSAIVVAAVIYLIVNAWFFDLVKNASTHGNTIHGWYSKYNRGEKSIAWLWFIVYPLVASFVVYWINVGSDRWQEKCRSQRT